ncbi:hypothetical protein [uncultured Sphingomonas sp.]|nr:hypothetical protein [uncultured Sphingomonas sp.]
MAGVWLTDRRGSLPFMIYGFRQRQENARLIVSRIDLDALEEQE